MSLGSGEHHMGITADGYATIAAIVIGFGVAVLALRIQRETKMSEQEETTWVPWADRLILASTTIATVGLLALLFGHESDRARHVVAGTLTAAVVCLLGYPWAILAHYRLLGSQRSGPRSNPESPEGAIVVGTLIGAAGAAFAYCVVTAS